MGQEARGRSWEVLGRSLGFGGVQWRNRGGGCCFGVLFLIGRVTCSNLTFQMSSVVTVGTVACRATVGEGQLGRKRGRTVTWGDQPGVPRGGRVWRSDSRCRRREGGGVCWYA